MEVPREKLNLEDNPELLSPPIVDAPLYGCASAVKVLAFLPHAELDVEVDGAVVATQLAGFPLPNGEMVKVPDPLKPDQVVRARQRRGGIQSDWSTPVTVRDHLVDYPAGPPRPQVNPAPVHECGARTGVSNLLIGCNVWLTADGGEVGRVEGASDHQGINVTPDYGLGQEVVAHAELCKDPSPPSTVQISQPPPSPVPTPDIEPIHEGGEQLTLTMLANGARFTLDRNGAPLGTWRTWGQRHHVGLAPPFSAGETFSAVQRLCPADPPSDPGTETVQPCSALPAPTVSPIQDGDTSVTLLDFVPDARIKVFRNLVKAGDGGGPVVSLTQALHIGDTVHVIQDRAECQGSTAQEVSPRCVAPHVASDPVGLDLFPVGSLDYDGGTTTINGDTYSVKGTVFYPTESDGVNQPFYARLAKLGPVPIVFMAHGNHFTLYDPADRTHEACPDPFNAGATAGFLEIPNHKGYEYLQRQLARMGIIAASVYSNETNCTGGANNIHVRAQLILRSIAHFQTLAAGDPIFNGTINFSAVGLMGHSRGGEAVTIAPSLSTLSGVTIKAVLALAPTDNTASGVVPKDGAYLTILPAADGDVRTNPGAKFYDRAVPELFKSQLYVHFANHNFFNREWGPDAGVGPPIMARSDHERILSGYGCAFFRAALLNHPTTGYLVGTTLPIGVATANVFPSFEWKDQVTVDHHEDGNGINLNSLGQATAQVGGLVANEFAFAQPGDPGSLSPGATFNGTFYNDTVGMVAETKEPSGIFRTPLATVSNLAGREIWVRVAEVFDGTSVPAGATGFQLGVEDAGGNVGWIDADAVGGVPRPYPRTDGRTKTMLSTLRFRTACVEATNSELVVAEASAIQFRLNRNDDRALAFDVLQIVTP